MNNVDIERSLNNDSFVRRIFIGVFPADKLPTAKEFPGGYIANTQPSGMDGEHWVAFYCINNEVECFDSFGNNPAIYSEYLKNWLEDEYKIIQHEKIQSNNTTVCGQHCMFFILARAHNISYQNILSAYTENAEINDIFVCKLINKYFKLQTRVTDQEFLLRSLMQKYGTKL